MVKKYYVKPEMNFVKTRGTEAVADVCWAYAKNGHEFYYNTSGPGYAKITMTTTNGCDGGIIANVEYLNGATADKRSEIDAAVALAGGNSAEPFKGSPFSQSPGSSWS